MTARSIEKKIGNIALGASKKEVSEKLGKPLFLANISHHGQKIDVLGYELGNYWYHETHFFVFQDDALIAEPETALDLLKFLSQLHILQDVKFFDLEDQSAP